MNLRQDPTTEEKIKTEPIPEHLRIDYNPKGIYPMQSAWDKEKKKRLIHLICRVKGEKVYDETKEIGDTHIKLEDAELVINEVLGKMKVENADVL